MNRMFLSCALFVWLSAPAWAQITVSGEGKVSAVPDMATVVLAVVTEDQNAINALETNNATMSKLVKSLEVVGVTKKELHTDSFQVNPKYIYPKDQDPRLVGYVVVNHLTVTVCDNEIIGKVLDSSIRNGARVRGMSWGFKDPEKLLDQARVAAVLDAKRKATLMANTAGSTLGTLVSISENSHYTPRFGNSYAARAESSVPVEAGTQTLRVTVSVVWNVGPPVK